MRHLELFANIAEAKSKDTDFERSWLYGAKTFKRKIGGICGGNSKKLSEVIKIIEKLGMVDGKEGGETPSEVINTIQDKYISFAPIFDESGYHMANRAFKLVKDQKDFLYLEYFP